MAETYPDVEKIVNQALGPSGFMEFMRFDHGEVVGKDQGAGTPKGLRLVVGNPLIMKRMVEYVPHAGSYAPVTILFDERADGVHLSCDTMASLLTSCANQEAMKVAQDWTPKSRHF